MKMPASEVRTLDMVDLSRYGQPRQDPPGDLSVGVTTPIRLPGKDIEALTLKALDRMTEDFGFTNRRPSAELGPAVQRAADPFGWRGSAAG